MQNFAKIYLIASIGNYAKKVFRIFPLKNFSFFSRYFRKNAKKISAERFTLFAGNPNIDTYPIQNSKYCIHCKLYLQKQKRTQNFSVFACYQFLLVTKVIYAF